MQNWESYMKSYIIIITGISFLDQKLKTCVKFWANVTEDNPTLNEHSLSITGNFAGTTRQNIID